MKRFFALRKGLNRHKEHGLTVIETVVTLVLLSIIVLFTTTTVLNTTQTSDNFAQGVNNESNLLDAMSLISRDVSLASGFKYAGADALSITTTDSGTESQVYYFVWDRTTNSIPTNSVFAPVKANSSKLPSSSGLIEYRVVNGDNSNPIIRNLIPQYTSTAGGTQLFTYFNDSADEVLLETGAQPHVHDSNLDSIRRVEMHFTSHIKSRNNAMEMHTSAVPRFMGLTTNNEGGNLKLDDNQLPAPELNGNLPRQSNTSQLWWQPVAGADSYEVYYKKDGAGDWQSLKTVPQQSGTIKTTHENLAWGSDYSYKVLAYDHRGQSNDSNVTNMRVTPEPTQFDNIDPKRGLKGESWANYTVARDLQNSLYWKKSNGSNTKYKVRGSENSGTWNVIFNNLKTQTTIESGKDFGDITDYTVTAYNDIVVVVNPDGSTYQTGGEAKASPVEKLVSPPIQPVIRADAYNDIFKKNSVALSSPLNEVTVVNDAQIKTENQFKFYVADTNDFGSAYNEVKVGANTKVYSDNLQKHTSYTENKGWGTRSYYFAVASNDAGDSPASAPVGNKADQHPGPFNITELSNPEGYANFFSQDEEFNKTQTLKQIGLMSGTWTKSMGNGGYTLDRKVTNSLGAPVLRSATDPNNGKEVLFESTKTLKPNDTNFSATGTAPGVIYTVELKAKGASNDLVRTESKTLLTRPDVARSGYLEAMCLADEAVGSNQTYGMFVRANTIPKYGTASKVHVSYSRSRGNVVPTADYYSLSTNGFYYQELSGLYDSGVIKLTNVIGKDIVPNSMANFGTEDHERTSETPYLTISMQSHFGVPCSFSYGYAGPDADEGNAVIDANGKNITKNGHKWIVHQFVCYGYVAGRAYGDFWVIEGREYKKGYSTSQKNAYTGTGKFIRKSDFINTDGCIWRLDPYGAEPYWKSME